MIPESVIRRLLDKEVLAKILVATESKGYKNIAIFMPIMESQNNQLHFLVEANRERISLFDLASLTRKIAESLQVEDIILLEEAHFAPEYIPRFIGPRCCLATSPIDNIEKFCMSYLINPIQEFQELSIKH